MSKVLSIICARASSKGLKNKCMAKIKKKTVVEYSIEYSMSLGREVKTVVSTDIEELIDHCAKNNIPYVNRDKKLCLDESRIDDALADAIEKEKEPYEYCSLVYGNIPTRYPSLFREALEFLEKNKSYDAAISMQNVEKFHPEWMFDLNTEILPKVKEIHYRRQVLPQKMIHDSHTLLFRSEGFYKRYKGLITYEKGCRYSIFGAKIKPLINNEVIIDIDTEKDLKLAQAFLLANEKNRIDG
jgi:CMP-N-acetylneuraminic acid synthetase